MPRCGLGVRCFKSSRFVGLNPPEEHLKGLQCSAVICWWRDSLSALSASPCEHLLSIIIITTSTTTDFSTTTILYGLSINNNGNNNNYIISWFSITTIFYWLSIIIIIIIIDYLFQIISLDSYKKSCLKLTNKLHFFPISLASFSKWIFAHVLLTPKAS